MLVAGASAVPWPALEVTAPPAAAPIAPPTLEATAPSALEATAPPTLVVRVETYVADVDAFVPSAQWPTEHTSGLRHALTSSHGVPTPYSGMLRQPLVERRRRTPQHAARTHLGTGTDLGSRQPD